MDHASDAARTDLMTITRYVLNEQSKRPESRGDFTILLNHIVLGCKFVCSAVSKVLLLLGCGFCLSTVWVYYPPNPAKQAFALNLIFYNMKVLRLATSSVCEDHPRNVPNITTLTTWLEHRFSVVSGFFFFYGNCYMVDGIYSYDMGSESGSGEWVLGGRSTVMVNFDIPKLSSPNFLGVWWLIREWVWVTSLGSLLPLILNTSDGPFDSWFIILWRHSSIWKLALTLPSFAATGGPCKAPRSCWRD